MADEDMIQGFLRKLGIGGETAPQEGLQQEPGMAEVPGLQMRAARAKQLGEALRQSGQFSGQSEMVGGRVVPIGIGGALAKLGSSWIGGQQDKKAEGYANQAGQITQKDLARSLQEYTATNATDPQKANAMAMGSPHKQLQALGQAGLTNYNKASEFGKTPHADADGGMYTVNGLGQRQVVPGAKAPVKALPPIEVAIGKGADGKDMFQKFAQKPDGTVDKARPQSEPYGKTGGVNINMGDKLGLEAGKETIKDVSGASYQRATTAADTLQNVVETIDTLNQGVKTGILAEPVQIMQKIGMAVGIPAEQAGNFEVLKAGLRKNVMSELGGKLGTGVSNADVSFVQNLSAQTMSEPQTIKRLSAILAARDMKRIEAHNKQVDSLGGDVSDDWKQSRKVQFASTLNNDPEFSAMVENVLAGRSTMAGMAAPAAQAPAAKTPPKVSSEADYSLLPPGAQYYDPAGKLRVKGK